MASSLITYPRTQTHADIPEDVRLSYGLTNDLLRLSIGIEDVDDLIEDLKMLWRTSMGQYDFTTRPNRLKQFTYKWQSSEDNPDLLQLWVADMDFLPVPEIKDAIVSYGQEHIFGYNYFKDSLYQAVIDWEKSEHGYEVKKEDISFIDGVVPAISVAIQAFTQKGDAVLINSPVYYPFARTVRLNDRKLVENSLSIQNGHFEIDFEQLEKDIVDNHVKLYIFAARIILEVVWSEAELKNR